MTDRAAPGWYYCETCGDAWDRADFPPGEALALAQQHPCNGEPDPRFDADLDADDYEVDFEMEGSA